MIIVILLVSFELINFINPVTFKFTFIDRWNPFTNWVHRRGTVTAYIQQLSTLSSQQSSPFWAISDMSAHKSLIKLGVLERCSRECLYLSSWINAFTNRGYLPSSPKTASLLALLCTERIVLEHFWFNVSDVKVPQVSKSLCFEENPALLIK